MRECVQAPFDVFFQQSLRESHRFHQETERSGDKTNQRFSYSVLLVLRVCSNSADGTTGSSEKVATGAAPEPCSQSLECWEVKQRDYEQVMARRRAVQRQAVNYTSPH